MTTSCGTFGANGPKPQRESRSLRLEVAQDVPEAATRLAEPQPGGRAPERHRRARPPEAGGGCSSSNGRGAAAGTGIFDDLETVRTLERMGNGSFPIGSVDLGPLSTAEELVQRINTGTLGPAQAGRRG